MIQEVFKHKLFLGLATLFLFLSFAFNAFGTISTEGFLSNYKDSEALVVNQIVCNGQPYGNQLLSVSANSIKLDNSKQITDDCSEKSVIPYSSQFGLQGKFNTAMYEVVGKPLHLTTSTYVVILQISTAFLSAILFALLGLWALLQLGKIPSLILIMFVALSPMIVGFSHNLYWALPLLIAPLVYTLFLYRTNLTKRRAILFFLGLGILLYIRYLCGYEYITTITIMVVAAVIYWLVVGRVKSKVFIQQSVLILAVSVIAFGLSLITHVAALNTYTNSTSKSLNIIKQRAEERTINADKYTQYPYMNLKNLANDHYEITNGYFNYEKRMEGGSVLWATFVAISTYLLLPVVHLPITFVNSFGEYIQSMLFVGVILLLLYLYRSKWVERKQLLRVTALFAATAVGFIGYLSWLVLAYSHSLVHAHINGILMYLPTALFGFMIIGLYIEFLIKKYVQKNK